MLIEYNKNEYSGVNLLEINSSQSKLPHNSSSLNFQFLFFNSSLNIFRNFKSMLPSILFRFFNAYPQYPFLRYIFDITLTISPNPFLSSKHIFFNPSKSETYFFNSFNIFLTSLGSILNSTAIFERIVFDPVNL